MLEVPPINKPGNRQVRFLVYVYPELAGPINQRIGSDP